MKILYAIQGTGNGHISRALEIIPHLKRKGELDLLISGTSFDLKLPYEIKFKLNGLSFVFGKQGGVDIWNTYLKMNSLRLLREINSLPIEKYDLVISDFEPVSSWACNKINKPCIGLSNQVASLSPFAPKPKHKDVFGKFVLQHYAPTAPNFGFHFINYSENIFTPVIRRQVRELNTQNKGHYTVYLPSYDDERIIKNLKRFKDVEWQVFSKHNKKPERIKNISIKPINSDLFLKSLANAEGIICNAGFGATSEALFLEKKLLVIPMKTQYEQHCNAAVLNSMGVSVMKSLKKKHAHKIESWLEDKNIVRVNYPNITSEIVEKIMDAHTALKYINVRA